MGLASDVGLYNSDRRAKAASDCRGIVAAPIAYYDHIQLARFGAVGHRAQSPRNHRSLIVRRNDYGNHRRYRTAVALANALDPSTHSPLTGSNCLTTRPGLPATTEFGGTLRLTTAFAPITELLPITSSPLPQTMAAPKPIQHPSSMRIVPPFVTPWSLIATRTSSKAWL